MSKINVEELKISSDNLRGKIVEELANNDPRVTEETYQLLKFHGMYLQDDRDKRRELKGAGLPPAYSFMIRSRVPGGLITAHQYLVHDEIADRWGNGTIRLTTREAFQIHGVLKGNVKPVLRSINDALLSTISACGDVNRNVVVTPDPVNSTINLTLQTLGREIADHLTPKSRAYHEIWLDEERVGDDPEDPIYGKTYLPRKFKIGITKDGDNSIDILTHDIGLVAICNGTSISHFNVFAGGGLGKTHNNEETFPRLADLLGACLPDQVLVFTEAIVKVQRDYGNRENRKLSRLKYLIQNRGVDWFRKTVESVAGIRFMEGSELSPWSFPDYYGWHDQSDSLWTLGLFIENGRIADVNQFRLKSALKQIAGEFPVSFRITATQDIQIRNVSESQKGSIEEILTTHGVSLPSSIPVLHLNSMACPALPTCGLAISESERVSHEILDEINACLNGAGLPGFPLISRFTGCPNGCARPYTAELAFVGRSGSKYEIHAGGAPGGNRLTKIIHPALDRSEFTSFFSDLFGRFAAGRSDGESFGDWVCREVIESKVN